MMMTRSVPQGNNFYTFFFFFFLCFLQVVSLIPSTASDDSTLSQTRPIRITEKETIVSPGDVFELGLFKPHGRDRWYLGIWYKRFERRVVWVANRDNPLSSSMGTLKVVNSNIVLFHQSGVVAWTTNNLIINSHPLVANLLDSGNFVLRYSKSNSSSSYLWQSFDFPTDTLLPGMKLGWDRRTNINRRLSSWTSSDDPSRGSFVFKIDVSKLSQGLLLKDDVLIFRTGPTYRKLVNITETDDEITHILSNTTANVSISLLTIWYTGLLRLEAWTGEWNAVWSFPADRCDEYGACGQNSLCNMVNNTNRSCDCIPGFQLDNQQNRCVRKSKLSCDQGDFLHLKNMNLPRSEGTIVDTTIGLLECKQRCLTNCYCTAVANTDMRNGGSGCVIWTGDLVDLRNYSIEGQDLFIKSVSEDLGVNKKTIIGSVVGGCLLLLLSFFVIWSWMRRKKRTTAATVSQTNQHLTLINTSDDWGSKKMDSQVIITATNNFAEHNKLGKGGFGIVYKGQLSGGQEIAVKRLTRKTPKGLEGFENEVRLIAMLQHRNLIRLVGFCSDENEKMLVYELVENASVDKYIFDTTRGFVLNWENRFDIINGVVRGLVYLHQDSRFRIIHLDLKPGNILLDKDLNPKISDFGMAKILGGNENEAHVTTVTGTFGYIAPEYRNDGELSVKSDVYSFGVMLLEIISGERNIDFLNLNDGSTLLSYIWNHWSVGNGLEVVDPAIKDSSSSVSPSQQVLRCIQIGLLCVQELPEDRPTMSSVGLMLEREAEAIPQPKSPVEIGSSSTGQHESVSGTVPETTMFIEAR